jgi:hypothetical protein
VKPETPEAVILGGFKRMLCDIYFENTKNGFRRAFKGQKVK